MSAPIFKILLSCICIFSLLFSPSLIFSDEKKLAEIITSENEKLISALEYKTTDCKTRFLVFETGWDSNCLMKMLRYEFNISKSDIEDEILLQYIDKNKNDIVCLLEQIDFGNNINSFVNRQTNKLTGYQDLISLLAKDNCHYCDLLKTLSEILEILDGGIVWSYFKEAFSAIDTISQGIAVYNFARKVLILDEQRCVLTVYFEERQNNKSPANAYTYLTNSYCQNALELITNLEIPKDRLPSWLEFSYICYRLVGYTDSEYIRNTIGNAIVKLISDKIITNNPPTVSDFDVTPRSITLGDTFTISYRADDFDADLKQVELWRKKTYLFGLIEDPWELIDLKSCSGNEQVYISGEFSDTPSTTGNYTYGIHAVDSKSNVALEPSPISVIVRPNIVLSSTTSMGSTSTIAINSTTSSSSNTTTAIFTTTVTEPLSITNISPSSATKGTTVTFTLTGTGFQSGFTAQIINELGIAYDISSREFVSSTQVRVTVYLGSGPTSTQYIKIINPDGQNAQIGFTALGNVTTSTSSTTTSSIVTTTTSSSSTSTTVKQQPVISSISPSSRAYPAGTFDLTIYGSNFDYAVDMIYTPSGPYMGSGVIKSRSATQLVVTEAMADTGPGTYSVRVKNSDGQLSNSVSLVIK